MHVSYATLVTDGEFHCTIKYKALTSHMCLVAVTKYSWVASLALVLYDHGQCGPCYMKCAFG